MTGKCWDIPAKIKDRIRQRSARHLVVAEYVQVANVPVVGWTGVNSRNHMLPVPEVLGPQVPLDFGRGDPSSDPGVMREDRVPTLRVHHIMPLAFVKSVLPALDTGISSDVSVLVVASATKSEFPCDTHHDPRSLFP